MYPLFFAGLVVFLRQSLIFLAYYGLIKKGKERTLKDMQNSKKILTKKRIKTK